VQMWLPAATKLSKLHGPGQPCLGSRVYDPEFQVFQLTITTQHGLSGLEVARSAWGCRCGWAGRWGPTPMTPPGKS